MNAILATVFVASLLGSLHCVGMCGPFALLAGTGDGQSFQFRPTLAYSFGRLLSYTTVGAVFGAMGLAINQSGSIAGWQQAATWMAGLAMIFVGVVALVRHLGGTIRLPRIAAPLERTLHRLFQLGKTQPPLRRALIIGISSSLMPCGWLYAFAISAAGTGSPFQGAILMATFWAGTIPLMVLVGLGAGQLSRSLQTKVPITMAALTILVGLFTIGFRSPIALGGRTVGQNVQEAQHQIETLDHEKMPCCQAREAASE